MKHKKSQTLKEEVQYISPTAANEEFSLNGIMEFITDTYTDDFLYGHIIVKAVIIRHGEIKTYDVHNEFYWQPGLETALLKYHTNDVGEDHQTSLESLNEDFSQILDAIRDGGDDNGTVGIQLVADNEDRGEKCDVSNVIIEDQSNVVYLVSYENAARDRRAFGDLVDSCCTIINDLTNTRKLDTETIHEGLDRAAQDHDGTIPENIQLLYKLLNPHDNYRRQDIQRAQANANNDDNANAERANANNDDNANAERANANNNDNAKPDKEPDKGDDNNDVNNTLNGMRFMGEIENTEGNRNAVYRGEWENAIALSPLSLEEFKNEMRSFPPGIAARFTGKPVYYMHIDDGQAKDPTLNALRYFFIFDNPSTVTWKRVLKQHVGVLRATNIDERVFRMMLRQGGASWKSLFYRTSREKMKNNSIQVIYADADKYVEKDGGKVVGITSNASQDGQPVMDERAITIKLLTQRLDDELVDKGFLLDRRIATHPPVGKKKGKTLVTGRAFDPNSGHFVGPLHKFTHEDAVVLANAFDDWDYVGYDQNTADTLNRVMDISTLPIRAEFVKQNQSMFDRKRDKFQDDSIEKLQADIDKRVAETLKIVRVNLVVGDTNRQDGIPKDENPYFNVRLPGVGKISYAGEEAVGFLSRFGIWQKLKPIFDDTAKEINGLKLILTMNSKLEK